MSLCTFSKAWNQAIELPYLGYWKGRSKKYENVHMYFKIQEEPLRMTISGWLRVNASTSLYILHLHMAERACKNLSSFFFLHIKYLIVQKTVTMSCVEQTVVTPVPAALMPPVSMFAQRDVSVMRAFSGVGQDVSLWRPVAANMMASTLM